MGKYNEIANMYLHEETVIFLELTWYLDPPSPDQIYNYITIRIQTYYYTR